MADFTHKLPDSNAFNQTLQKILKKDDQNDLLEMLRGSNCMFVDSTSYSKRYNAYWMVIEFEIPTDRLFEYNEEFLESANKRLTEYCDNLLPLNAGYDVHHVNFKHLFQSNQVEEEILDVEKTIESLKSTPINEILSYDLVEKGEDMARVYSYLYFVETFFEHL